MDRYKTVWRCQEMKKDVLKSIIVLSAICLIVALLLSSLDLITSPLIEKAELEKEEAAFLEVLPNAAKLENVELGNDIPASVKVMKKDTGGSGYAFKLVATATYSGNPMTIIVGIDADGKITKLSFVEYTDSPGIGTPEGFDKLFKGKDNTTADNDAGATITTNAIKAVLNDAYSVLAKYSSIEQTDEQKLSTLYDKLMPSAKSPMVGAYKFNKYDISQLDGLDPAITAAFTPSNEIGYIVLVSAEDKTVAVAVNAFGKAYAVYDLDGNDLTAYEAYDSAKQKAEALPPVYLSKQTANSRRIKNAFKNSLGEESANNLNLEAIALPEVSSTVAAAYKVNDRGNVYYAFIAQTVGYGGRINVLYVTDMQGKIVLYKTTTHSESSGYGAAIAESAYTDKLAGSNITTLGDETVQISGATITSEAVKQTKNDIKAAFDAVKEGF